MSSGAAGTVRIPDRRRRRMYRVVFVAAALYNLAFGAWAVLWPGALFDWSGVPLPRYPALWQCLGMVVGVYGLLYAHAAVDLERARPVIAVGLLGKVCGPLGFLDGALRGAWPLETLPLIVFNDLLWWGPFLAFLLEGTRVGERLRAWVPDLCAGIHLLALAAMGLVLMPGTELDGDLPRRAAYIGDHLAAWRAGWMLWILSGTSLLWFYAWWGARFARPWTGPAAVALATLGFCGDGLAEALYVSRLPGELAWVGPLGSALTAGWANALYTLGGVVLTLDSPTLTAPLRGLAWTVWALGAGMTLSWALGWPPGLLLTSALLFPLFCALCVLARRHPWT